MSKIDVGQWGEFHLYDLFTIDAGSKLDRKDVNLFPGSDYNYIGRTGDNNGIIGTCNLVNIKKKSPYPAGALTVSLGGTVGATFVQQKPFYTSQNVDVLLPLQSMSDGVKWFIASCIYREAVLNYSAFVKELNKHIKTDFYIKLPITSDGKPDWKYMDDYIAELAAHAHKDVSSLNQAKSKPHKINISNWKEFKVEDLFDVGTGASVSKSILEEHPGNIPRISVTNEDNGIVGFYSDFDNKNLRLFTNFISVNFFGQAFYHSSVASLEMKVHALKLKSGRQLTANTGLFLASVLNMIFAKENFDYGHQLSSSMLKSSKFQIKLPATADGDPDFDYMEHYIENMSLNAIKNIKELQKAVNN